MVNVAEEIEINLDPSNAISGLGQIAKALDDLGARAGVPAKALNQASAQMERGIATVAAAVARQQAAHVGNTKAIQAEAGATQKLAEAQARATAKTGVAVNAKGQAYNTSSGRFASADQSAAYRKELELQQKLIQVAPQLDRMRSINAQNAYAAAQKQAQATRQETDAYKTRQAQLEKAFKGNIVGLAAPDATRWQKFSNVLGQIPPVRMAGKLAEVQQRIMGMSNSTRYALYDVSHSFGIAGAAIMGFGVLSIKAAIDHERAFANVARTTMTTAEGYSYLQRQLEVMSMSLPVTFEELTNIASAAGQLGISAAGVSSFTSTVAKLSATTNLTSEAAGVALARFRAFFAEVGTDKGLNVTERTFSNLASSILLVGVNSIATETGIVNVATQIASMGQYAGYTANQTVGLAGALSSIGVAPELSRGTITRTFSNIGTAVSKGGERLEQFAALSGRSSAEFVAAWGTDKFAGVFTDMMKGLYGVTQGGEDANLMLMELGFNSVRDRPLLLRLAGAANEAGQAGGLLTQTMADALSGWTANSELALQYNKISTTTSARIQVLAQSFEQLFATMGAQSGGFVGELALQMTQLVRGFEAFSNSDAGQVFGTIAVQGALVVGALMLIIATAARGAASLQGIGTAWSNITNKTGEAVTAVGRFGTAMKIANLSLGLIGLVATIASVVAGFAMMQDASQKAKRGVQDLDGLVAAMAEDAQNGGSGLYFYSQQADDAGENSKAAARQAADMGAALDGAGAKASGAAGQIDGLAGSTRNAVYVFGNASREFYKSQLAQSEAFQELFNPSKQYGPNAFLGMGKTLGDLGFNPQDLDWDKFIDDSLKGGIDVSKLEKELSKLTGISLAAARSGEGDNVAGAALKQYAADVAAAYGDLAPEIQAVIAGQNALGNASKQTFEEMTADGASAGEMLSKLSEDSQKAAEASAQGYAKFVDVGKLLKLTQDQGSQSAEEFAEAWSNAYGGSSIKLGDYLANFRRAADEQTGFINNLQELSARGLSDGIIAELSAMGPEANRLVQALVTGTDEQLGEFEQLWGQTGYDSMVLFAVQAELGQQLINTIMGTGGRTALESFNKELSSGVGVNEALAKLQRDVNGKPITPKTKPVNFADMTPAQKAMWAARNALHTIATISIPNVNDKGIKIGTKTLYPYAAGGYTGDGGKYDPAGVVHRGEFVMTKEATRRIGVDNLYSMMNAAQSGRSAPRGAGYASGGSVNGSPAPMMVYLSPDDRQLLRSIQPLVMIGDREIARANSEANFRTTRGGVG